MASELKIAIAHGPECPNCGEDGFDDWWHDKTTKTGHRPVSLEARLRCHGCGRFFHVTQYGDGETHSRSGGTPLRQGA
jgi:hypothetical protein